MPTAARWLPQLLPNAQLVSYPRWMEAIPSAPLKTGMDVSNELDDLLPRFDADRSRVAPETELVKSVEKLLESRETSEFVRRAIDQLPEGYRNVLLIRDIEGYDTKEAAALLGLTPGAVKVRLHRARAALITLLEPIMRGERP